MKKLLLAVLSIYALSGISYAVDFGIGIKGGVGQNNPKTMKALWNYYGGTITKAPGIFSLEIFCEENTSDPELEFLGFNKAGFKIGYDFYGKNKLETTFHAEEKTTAIPVTFYIKSDKGIKKLSPFIGAGFTVIKTKATLVGESFKKEKVFPHIMLGVENKFTENISIGFEVKYNITASTKIDGYILSDRSGFQGLGVLRFYF